nr:PhoP/PhoQ regulator MgrB [Nissabacter sp. SGAir0207]
MKTLGTLLLIGAACIALYLLALNSYCDQGGNFTLGMCSVTSFIPF